MSVIRASIRTLGKLDGTRDRICGGITRDRLSLPQQIPHSQPNHQMRCAGEAVGSELDCDDLIRSGSWQFGSDIHSDPSRTQSCICSTDNSFNDIHSFNDISRQDLTGEN
jgi:hypothetical protein